MAACNGKLTCPATLRGSTDLLRAKSVGLRLHHRRHTASRPNQVTKEAHVFLNRVQVDLQPGWEGDVHGKGMPFGYSWMCCVFLKTPRMRCSRWGRVSIQRIGRPPILAESAAGQYNSLADSSRVKIRARRNAPPSGRGGFVIWGV